MRTEEQKKNKRLDELIDSIELRSPHPKEEHSAEKSFTRLMARISANANPSDVFRRRANHYRIWLAAATVALLIAMGGWLQMALESDPTFVVTANNSGIVQEVPLPDGTIIQLNNRSKLIYPEQFMGDLREVFLEGEAYFDVAHNKKKPFVVSTGELKIRVLGTKFTVNAISMNSQITTILLEGSIDVSDSIEHKLMKPNQQLTYDINTRKMSLVDLANTEKEVRWTQNVWVLSDTPLLTICQRLEQQFGVKFIVVNDELIEKSFTGEFQTSEPLDSILKTIQITTPFKYERKGDNIILK